MKGQMNQGHLYLGSPAEHPSPFFDLAVIACTSPSSHATGIVHEWHSGKADCMMLSPRFVEKLAFSLAFKWFEKGLPNFPTEKPSILQRNCVAENALQSLSNLNICEFAGK
jgi:hypothetical protein